MKKLYIIFGLLLSFVIFNININAYTEFDGSSYEYLAGVIVDIDYENETVLMLFPVEYRQKYSAYNNGGGLGTFDFSDIVESGIDDQTDIRLGVVFSWSDGAGGWVRIDYDDTYSSYYSGYQAGYQAGYSVGYHNGVGVGYDNGYSVGYDNGYDNGYDDGYQAGYDSFVDTNFPFLHLDKINDNLQDYIDYNNLIFYDNVGQVTYNSASGFVYEDLSDDDDSIVFRIHKPNNSKGGGIILYDTNVLKRVVIPSDIDNIYIRIYKSVLPSPDLNGFNTYLSQNPLTITYELEEKQEYIISEEEIAQLPFYNIGKNSGKLEAEKALSFDWLSSIFSMLGSFLSIPIFGEITIGMIVAVPLLISVVMFIIKLVRG